METNENSINTKEINEIKIESEIKQTNKEKTMRNSSFELLRIIAMIMIVAHHFYVHGGLSEISRSNYLVMQIFNFGGKFGVILFMLISGYFMIKSRFKLSKLIKLIVQVFFYSVGIYLIFCACGLIEFNLESFKVACFPVSFKQYWFVTNYLIIYILSPFLNKMLISLNKKEYIRLLVICFAIYFILYHTISISSDFPIFFLLYFSGAFLRLHKINIFKKTTHLFMVVITLFVALLVLQFLTPINFYRTDSYLSILLACFVMLLFERFNFSSKFINIVASATFGVYLIHDNKYLRHVLWKDIFKNPSFAFNNWLPFYGIGVVLLVFVACVAIDLIRSYFIERLILKTYSKIKLNKKY